MNDACVVARFEGFRDLPIDHPNVAQIFEIGEADGVHFIAMQFVDGKNLAVRVKGDTLATADIISRGLQVADALDAAHGKVNGNCLPLWVDQGDGGVVGSTKD